MCEIIYGFFFRCTFHPAAAVLGGAAFPGGSRASEQTQCSAFHPTTPVHGHFIACQRQSA